MTDYLSPVLARLDEFSDYQESLESFFASQDTEIQQYFQSNYHEGIPAEHYWLEHRRVLMRISLFFSLYAFIEFILDRLCGYEGFKKKKSLKPSDLKGN